MADPGEISPCEIGAGGSHVFGDWDEGCGRGDLGV